jgi:hypothetical protein
MSSIKVYDKVKWHYPEGKNCPSLDAAKRHFVAIMEWSHKNGLLSDYGNELYELGLDSDFALTSDMFTDEGKEILDRGYEKWLRLIAYDRKPDTAFWDGVAATL